MIPTIKPAVAEFCAEVALLWAFEVRPSTALIFVDKALTGGTGIGKSLDVDSATESNVDGPDETVLSMGVPWILPLIWNVYVPTAVGVSA
jgi:hypothetical protein